MPFGVFFSIFIDMNDSFWIRVKHLIKAHRISQAKFAEYVGLTARTFWGWIYHDRIPDAATACSIAEALGVTVEYLVRGTDDINTEDKMHRTFTRKTTAALIQKLAHQIEEETKELTL